jgi:deazaflavin-dependent oxidoreductase (nitroreductase family)
MTTAHYKRPSRFRTVVINPLVGILIRRFGMGGSGADLLRILRVRGRKSGRLYEIPVRVAILDDQRYLVSMLGEAQWVRNLRTAGAAELVLASTTESIRAREIHGEQKQAFLRQYFQHPQFELRARYALKVDTKHLTPAEVDRAAGRYPVFRLEPLQPSEHDEPEHNEPAAG